MSDWLELELADRLAPAEAPDALWYAIERARTRPPARALHAKWPVAAIATIVLAAGVLWFRPNLPQSLEARAVPTLVLHSSSTITPASSSPAPEASCHLCHRSL